MHEPIMCCYDIYVDELYRVINDFDNNWLPESALSFCICDGYVE